MSNLVEYGLRENPFSLLPSSHVTHWAGRSEVRAHLLDIVQSILVTDTGVSEFVILHGSFGAGKSHALRYLTTLINEREKDRFRAVAIYMSKVKLSERISFLELYFQIMQQLGKGFLQTLAEEVRRKVGSAASDEASKYSREEERRLLEEDPSYFKTIVLNSLDKEERNMIQLLLALAENNESKVEQYLTEGKPIPPGTDFTQAINTDYMATRILAGLFRAMTLRIGNQEPVYYGVHLFLDEVEDLLEAKSAEQSAFWTSIRELVNRLPYNFALLLAFSADAALLEAIIPVPLAERLSRPNVEFPALDVDEAKDFIKSHLGSFRPEGFTPSQPYHPFAEEAIDYILEHIVILIPRKLFRELRIVMERAIKRERLEPGREITAEMAEDILTGMST